jgi:hypothetical protein
VTKTRKSLSEVRGGGDYCHPSLWGSPEDIQVEEYDFLDHEGRDQFILEVISLNSGGLLDVCQNCELATRVRVALLDPMGLSCGEVEQLWERICKLHHRATYNVRPVEA